MSYPASIVTSQAVCTAIREIAGRASWSVRIHAAALALRELTGRDPRIVPVRAVAYTRGAVLRLGGALFPTSAGELEYFREQVGRGMLLLGFDSVHAVVAFDDHALELSLPGDHTAGVMTEPFAFEAALGRERALQASAPRFGVSYVFDVTHVSSQLPAQKIDPLAQRIADRARELLDEGRIARGA
ncbi:MAG: hypothetical protein KDC46_00115 [Thermoleophilia bacterium]|nr:hypothetical protein [Thermoleophilia bacterium]